jgi:hypothetical protein
MQRLPVFAFEERANAEENQEKCESMLHRIDSAEERGSEYCVLNPAQLVLLAHYLYRQSKKQAQTVEPDKLPCFEPEQLQYFASIGHVVNKSNLQSTLVKLAQRVQTQQVKARR